MGEIEEAINEVKAKLEDKAVSKPAGHQPDPADEEDKRKLFVGGLAQVNMCHNVGHMTVQRSPSGCQGY